MSEKITIGDLVGDKLVRLYGIPKPEIMPEQEEALEPEVVCEEMGWTEDQLESGLEGNVNAELEPAFDRGMQERTVQVLTTNTLDNTFYVSKEKISDQAIEVLEEMRENDPEFLAKALVYAREEGLLQLAPTLGLAVLSKAEDKEYFRTIFPRIISTPDNLAKFAEICKEGKIRKSFGGVATKAVKEWLEGLTEYHAIKYSGKKTSEVKDGKVVKNNFSLRDLIIMSHPKPENEEEEERLNWLVTGHHDEEKLAHNPKIAAYEALKKAETDEERIDLISKGKLSWEAVIPAVPKMTPELWQALMKEMPYMALLRNINNFAKNELLEDEENVAYLVERLTDAEAIKKAKILPFRFYGAYVAYTGKVMGERNYDWDWQEEEQESEKITDSRIEAALEEALELSFENMPEIPGTVAIGSDVSGSMDNPISEKGKTRYIDICGVFTGALLKKIPGRAIPLPFEHDVVDIGLSAEDRILETTKKIASVRGGGTALGAPIEKLLRTKTKVDNFIGITDNMDWAHGEGYYSKGSFLKQWRKYRKEINPYAQAFLIRIDPYESSVAPKNEPGVHFIYGWSDKVPSLIGNIIDQGQSQVDKVNAVEL